MTGYTLNDVGGALSWDALGAFLHYLDPTTATAQELEPELAPWATTTKTNTILADIYDVLSQINNNLVALGSHKAAKTIKPYPRPGDRNKKNRKIGKGALSPDELKAWFDNKRKGRKKKPKGGDGL